MRIAASLGNEELNMLEELNRDFQSLKARIQDIRSYL